MGFGQNKEFKLIFFHKKEPHASGERATAQVPVPSLNQGTI